MNAYEKNGREVRRRIEQQDESLRLRVTKPDVILEDLRPVLSKHQPSE